MQFTQIADFNPSTVGTAYLCEQYTESGFGAPHGREPYAYQAWLDAANKYPGIIPPDDIACPIFFNWSGFVGGVYRNWGHACIWNRGRIFSSPLSGTGHAEYDSLYAIQKAFGLGNYLGFTADIAGKVIIKEGELMFTPAQVNILIQATANRPATDDEKAVYSTLPISDVLNKILTSDWNVELRTDAQAYKDGQKAALTRDNVISYIQGNLK